MDGDDQKGFPDLFLSSCKRHDIVGRQRGIPEMAEVAAASGKSLGLTYF